MNDTTFAGIALARVQAAELARDAELIRRQTERRDAIGSTEVTKRPARSRVVSGWLGKLVRPTGPRAAH